MTRASRMARTCGIAAAVLIAALLPADAGAHAVLTHTEPHRGATVADAPPRVHVEFNEPITAELGSVRVYDSERKEVQEGEPEYPAGSRRSVTIGLEDGLPKGVYTLTYRVVSADGHPVSGGFAFGVGVAATSGDPPSVADLLGESDAGPAVEGAYGVVRGLHYAALLLMVGAMAFWALVCRGRPGARWPGRLLLAAAVLGLVTASAGLPLQGAVAAGVGVGDLLDRTVLEVSYDSRTGFAWAGRAVVWLGLIALLLLTRAPGRLRAALIGAGALLLVLSLPYGGHARTQSPEVVLVPADIVHVLAAGTWLGALVLLLVAFWPRRPAAEAAAGAAPGDLAATTDATRRFSALALPAVLVLVSSGLVQAWFYLGTPGELFDGSTYSLALIAKIALLAGIVALAAGNRRRLGRLGGGSSTPGALRSAMRAEVALAVLVLAATAVLVREPPPEAVATGPATRELDLGPMRLELVIEPATVGPNDLHLYFFDRRTGAQVDRVKEVTVRFTQEEKDIGPLRVAIPRKGVAHYERLGQRLDAEGEWKVEVDARLGGSDRFTDDTQIEVGRKK